MESVVVDAPFWKGKRVFLTGHTGFKGGWLSLWLHALGAEVHGYALEPPTEPNIFSVAKVNEAMASDTHGDIRNVAKLTASLKGAKPEIVVHLAAQPLVRDSYSRPVETYAINVMGTAHLLEAVRETPGVRAVVVVTTDKCYDNREWMWGYRESEPLGGHDPYSSSKACAELVTAAYRESYFAAGGISVASARAGNVIGGGDWARDRLVPDFLRVIEAGGKFKVRSPEAIRPWQHVLEPLSGYLILAERLYKEGPIAAEPWNFGPDDDDVRPVRWLVERLVAERPEVAWELDEAPRPHEANCLKLDSTKAHTRLGWRPRWRLATALAKTLEWHNAWRRGGDMHVITTGQIIEYQRQPTPV